VDPVTAALELAYAETEMDVTVLAEIRDGREVVRFAAGDLRSFGLAPGASMPVEDTYCHRLLTGRLSNYVPDTHADEQLRDLAITRAARVGAYLGVPLTALDARLYVLCCLAHEQRPQLGERDVRFLRGLGESILAQLQDRRAQPTDGSDLAPAR
jgi:GAF domain-containing protein